MEEMTLSLRELMRNAKSRLAASFGEREASAMVDEMMWRLKGWNRTDTIIHGDESVTEYLSHRVDSTIIQLLDGKPIQYIFGRAQFYGLDFSVSPATLIPRPETAQLVDIIADSFGKQPDLRVLDLGTGSGCIPIALARTLTFPKNITSVDISEKALEVAGRNAIDLKVNVNFICHDMLAADFAENHLHGFFDIIVSNPPYIAQFEAAEMERNVLEYEPHSALFVPDNDPLLFYRAIAKIASDRLDEKGVLFLEINPLFVKQLVTLLRENGFNDIDVVRDMQKAERFIIAKR